MNSYLFIGGTADGKRMMTDGGPRWRVPVPHVPPNMFARSYEFDAVVNFEVHEYHATQLHDGLQKRFLVYVHNRASNVIEALIAGYRRDNT